MGEGLRPERPDEVLGELLRVMVKEQSLYVSFKEVRCLI